MRSHRNGYAYWGAPAAHMRAGEAVGAAEFDRQLPSIDNRHARPTTTAPHLDSNQKEPGAHVIGPAGFPSIADVTALFCGGACRIVPSSTGGFPALCPPFFRFVRRARPPSFQRAVP